MRKSMRKWVALGIVAGVLCVCGAIFLGINYSVATSYNATAATLRANVAASRKQNPNVASLQAAQEQVNAQLADEASSHAVQLPMVKSSIARAQKISADLDRTLAQLKKQQERNSATNSASTQPNTTGANTANTANQQSATQQQNQEQQDQQEEQERAKLNALLAQNQSSSQNQSSTSQNQQGETSPDTQTTKPW